MCCGLGPRWTAQARGTAQGAQRGPARGAQRRGAGDASAPCWQSAYRRLTAGASVMALSLEGVSQTDSIPPGRLLTLVRPGNNLVLQRIQNLKRCAQACGCNITTPRYACNLHPGCISSKPTFAGLRKISEKQGIPKKGKSGFLWQSLTLLEMQPNLEANCGAYLGVVIIMLQPHACTQRFRFQILRRTRLFPGRTSVRSHQVE